MTNLPLKFDWSLGIIPRVVKRAHLLYFVQRFCDGPVQIYFSIHIIFYNQQKVNAFAKQSEFVQALDCRFLTPRWHSGCTFGRDFRIKRIQRKFCGTARSIFLTLTIYSNTRNSLNYFRN